MNPIIPFLLTAAVLVIGVIGVLSYRLWRAPVALGADEGVDAINVLRDQKRELDTEVEAGRITVEEREARLADLTRRVHDEGLSSTETPAPAVQTRRRVWLAAMIALLVPLIGAPIYLAIGNPAALDPALRASTAAPGGHGDMNEEQIRTLLTQLKQKLEANPNDARGWMMLGRGLRIVNDFAGSAQAFEKASALEPNDASLLADWADSLGMTQNRSLEGQPRELIQRALKVDPKYPKALALAASADYAAGKYPEAKVYWERLIAGMPPDSEAATEVRQILAQLDQKMGGSGVVASAPSAAKPAAVGVSSVTGTVKLSPSLASKVAPGDTLFIFARAVDGPRMPLAIIRSTAADLPKTFKLDDSMAMAGGPTLSSIAQVKIEARVSKTGDAISKPGDLRGESVVITPGMGNIEITIDKVVQ